MDRAVVSHRRDLHASLAELAGIGLALVTQHVVLVDDDERRRQAVQLLQRCLQWRSRRLLALGFVGQIGVPEPLHRLLGQPRAIGELVVGTIVEIGVGDGVEQHLLIDGRTAAFLGKQRHHRRHVAADAIACDREPGGVDLELLGMLGDIFGRSISLLDGNGIAGFRRALVVDEDDSGIGAVGDLAHQPVMRIRIAQHPAAAMEIENDRQCALGMFRADDAQLDAACRTSLDDPVLFLGGKFLHIALLRASQDIAGIGRRQRVDRLAAGKPVDEFLRCRLEYRIGKRANGGGCEQCCCGNYGLDGRHCLVLSVSVFVVNKLYIAHDCLWHNLYFCIATMHKKRLRLFIARCKFV